MASNSKKNTSISKEVIEEEIVGITAKLANISNRVAQIGEETAIISETEQSTPKVVLSNPYAILSTSKAVPSISKSIKSTSKALPSTSKAVPSTSKAVPSTSKAVPSTSKDVASTSHEGAMGPPSKKELARSLEEVEEDKENTQLEGNEESEEDDLTMSLLKVCNRRSRMPHRLKKVEARILKRQLKEADQLTVIPSQEIKKVVCKYSSRKPLPEELLTQPKCNPADFQTRAAQIMEKQAGLKKAMEERLAKEKK